MPRLTHAVFITLLVFIGLVLLVQHPNASYTIKNLNVTMTPNQNTSAIVVEQLHVLISNASVSQYSINRVALNLTLSTWQSLIGPLLVQHVINPNSSVYGFKFLPGPVYKENGQSEANIILSYYVRNVTTVNEIAPRIFQYRFNPKVLNFEHGASGEVLTPNTDLTIILPSESSISVVYPIPDLPPYAVTTNYKNVSSVSWLYGEPLTKFTLVYTVKQSIQAEVESFFSGIYNFLGIFTYVIIIIAVLLFILYVYYKASK